MTGELRRDITDAILNKICNVSNLPKWAQVDALGRNLRPLAETIADALIEAGLIPETTTTEEWSTRIAQEQRAYIDRKAAERRHDRDGSPVVRRLVTTYADRVTEWSEADE